MSPQSLGKPLTKRCPACGSRLNGNESVCPICGHEFLTAGAASSAPQPAPTKPVKLPKQIAPPVPATGSQRRTTTGSRKAVTKRDTVLLNAPEWSRSPGRIVGMAAAVLVLLGLVFWLTRPRPNAATPVDQSNFQITINQTVSPVVNAASAAEATAPAASTAKAPSPTPAVELPTPAPQEYIIAPSDTCGTIAEKFGVRQVDLLALNGLSEANCLRIRIGDKILIPAAGQTQATAPASEPLATLPPELVYEVKPGDVCSTIVQKFPGLTTEMIIRFNNLNASCTIQIGQKLTLRFASGTPTPTAPPQVATTPTPRTGYVAPQLIAPQEGTTFSETQQVITLQWLSVGLLKENEYYVVQIQPAGIISVPIFETKSTSLKIAQDIVGNLSEQRFVWFVSVKQKIATDPKTNAPIYNDLGPISQQRRFTWRRPQGTATPTP